MFHFVLIPVTLPTAELILVQNWDHKVFFLSLSYRYFLPDYYAPPLYANLALKKILINDFSQEWEHNNKENIDLFVKLLQRQNSYHLKYFEDFLPVLLVL